jgi:hypothetical protein
MGKWRSDKNIQKPFIIALDLPLRLGIQLQLEIGLGHGGLFLRRGDSEAGFATP